MTPVQIAHSLCQAVGGLTFAPPVTHVYNPLEYAKAASDQYLKTWARPGIKALLLGMNPGPWGMAQTGVPFGEVNAVKEFLKIDASIAEPSNQHPKRPVLGLECPRSEVSGRRMWGWAKETYTTPEDFFSEFFIWNYCPLAFLEESGKNRTPDKLPKREREALFPPCDEALQEMVKALRPSVVVGVGAFATKRALQAGLTSGLPIATVLHPSPASPAANRGWAAQATAQLASILPP